MLRQEGFSVAKCENYLFVVDGRIDLVKKLVQFRIMSTPVIRKLELDAQLISEAFTEDDQIHGRGTPFTGI